MCLTTLNDIVRVVAVIMFPIPLVHLWLHALLPWWKKQYQSYYVWFVGIFVVSFAAWSVVAPYDRQLIPACTTATIIGLIMIAGGGMLALWSFIVLGSRQFLMLEALQPSKKFNRRCNDGPFRLFPHPAYLGYCAVSGGIALVFTSWMTLFIMLYSFTLVPIVIYLEERELHSRYN